MKQIRTKIKLTKDTKVLVVSDIHLSLPITNELAMIQASLVERISELSSHKTAILVFNGDIFELWEQSSQTVEEIISGFADLTKAIREFSGPGHQVIFTVGNHDDAILQTQTNTEVIKKHWLAKVMTNLEFEMNSKLVLIEHGHEHDSYNKSGDESSTHGKTLVKSTLPKLIKHAPSLFVGIGDVVNRVYLPSYVLSRLIYGLVVPIVMPITLIFCIYFYMQNKDIRFITAFFVVWLIAWLIVLVADNILRMIAKLTFGGGSKYLGDLDSYQAKEGFDVLVLGHTHDGGVWKRQNYTYANSGCNDTIALPRLGWLGLHRFNRFVQMSDITIEPNKKQPINYHEHIATLVK